MATAKRLFLATAVLSCLVSGPALSRQFDMSQIYTIDTAHSYVGFQIKYMGFAKVRGRFTDFSGTVRFDDQDATRTSATVRIAVASLSTEHEWRDKDLKSDQWFDAETFPTIKFQSTRSEKTDIGFDIIGNITIRDVTKEVRLVMEEFSGVMGDIRGDSQVIFVGRTTIHRKEFGVKGDRWSRVKEGITGVADEVEVELTVLGKQINEGNFRNWVRDVEKPQGKVYQTISETGVSAGLQEFDAMLSEGELTAGVLNAVGYMLLKEGRVDDAVTVFARNIEAFPDMGDLHDSLAEAYAVKGEFQRAAENYRLALESNPDNVNAVEILRHLED